MASTDCHICSKKFDSLKLYNQHIVSKECPVQASIKKRAIAPMLYKREGGGTTKHWVKKKNITETIQPQQRGGVSNLSTAVIRSGKVRCELCLKMIKTRGMTQHLNMVHKCGHCGQLTENKDDHIAREHQTEQCPHCHHRFTDQTKLETHVQAVHLRLCEECDEKFLSEASLSEHLEDAHASEYCDICSEKLSKADRMTEHQDKAHGIKQKVIKEFGGGMMFMIISE